MQDASERGRLGASTFKLLNLALSCASVATLAVILVACRGSFEQLLALPTLLRGRAALCVALAPFCGALFVVAKK